MSRFKALTGLALSSRKIENQRIEASVKCQVLNRMASLDMVGSERIPVG